MKDFDLYMKIFSIVSVLMDPRAAVISLAIYGIVYCKRYVMSV